MWIKYGEKKMKLTKKFTAYFIFGLLTAFLLLFCFSMYLLISLIDNSTNTKLCNLEMAVITTINDAKNCFAVCGQENLTVHSIQYGRCYCNIPLGNELKIFSLPTSSIPINQTKYCSMVFK